MFVSSFISLPVSKENARLTHDMLHTEKTTKKRDSKIFLRYLLDDNINPIKLCPKFYHRIIARIKIILPFEQCDFFVSHPGLMVS